jgi:hypothetical protein
MTRKILLLLCSLAVFMLAGSCRTRTDRTAGTVLLTYGNITGIPTLVSMASIVGAGGPGQVVIQNFILQSVNKDPNGTTSSLQDIEVNEYQVTYKRQDSGTRLPPTLVAGLEVSVPINSTGTITNLPILRTNQLLNPPLYDLVKYGFDTETGTAVIVLECMVTFYGQTLSGDSVSSAPADFTIEFTP